MGQMPRPNNIIEVRPSNAIDFFRWWCVFLRPLINLTNREMDIVACFLKHRFELSRSISDPAILDSIIMSNDVKRKVMKECGVSQEHFYVILSNLRKSKVLVENTLNPRLIPNLRKDEQTGYFQLLILFDLPK